MKLWKKIKNSSKKKKRMPPRLSSLPKVVHILPTSKKSKNLRNPTPSAMAARSNEHPDIEVPPFSFQTTSTSNNTMFPNHPTSWDSIHNGSRRPSIDTGDQISVLTNENYQFSESRQDSFSGSLNLSRKVSFQSREAPPESARNKILAHNRSFRARQQAKHTKFTLRPKSIVRKWNRYADMEENGLAASPRHRTKLAKSLHLELAPTISSDSNEDSVTNQDPVSPAEDSMPVEQEKEDNVADVPESCHNCDVQDIKKDTEMFVAPEESESMLVGEDILIDSQESCATRDAPEDAATPREANCDSPPVLIRKADIQRITENGFPASVLDSENQPMAVGSSNDEPAAKATICASNESSSTSCSSMSEHETDLSNQSMSVDIPNEDSRQEEIVTLSLAQILVQSYQPDPDNPGYWKKKGAEEEPKTDPPKSFVPKNDPLPTLNTFLQEVKARRNEMFTKSNDVNQNGGEPDPTVDWYGAKRLEKQATSASRPKDLFAELKARRRPPVCKPHQKRVVVCKPSPAGSANDLLSELKAKQQEIKRRGNISPKKKERDLNEKGTGFLPDLMTELKAKQREIKNRPPSPPKPVANPSSSKKRAGSNPGVVSGLKAKQRAIEDRFYTRLANLQKTLRGNEVVIIPPKS